jgi:hypothetical protein
MEFKLHGTVVAPYVAQVIRRFLTEQNPELSKAKVRFSIVEDSVPAPRDIPQDTVRPDTARRIRPPR